MRTTLNIDDEALREAMRYAEGRNKTQVINEALRDYARLRRRRELLELRGTIVWEGDMDALYDRAREAAIPDRSRVSKDELIRALPS
ncbi:MAG: type II toxin-antitoxin system VapB family antitoxin [Myxococcota bacterium]